MDGREGPLRDRAAVTESASMAEKKRWVDGERRRVDAVLGGSNPSGVKGSAAGSVTVNLVTTF